MLTLLAGHCLGMLLTMDLPLKLGEASAWAVLESLPQSHDPNLAAIASTCQTSARMARVHARNSSPHLYAVMLSCPLKFWQGELSADNQGASEYQNIKAVCAAAQGPNHSQCQLDYHYVYINFSWLSCLKLSFHQLGGRLCSTHDTGVLLLVTMCPCVL